MEDPEAQPEVQQPLIGPAVLNRVGFQVPIKWIFLVFVTVVVFSSIDLLNAQSLDYKVWIEKVASMNGKDRQSAMFSIAGGLTTLFLICAPMDTFLHIWREGAVGQRTHVANVASVINSCIWMWYGLLPERNYCVCIINLTGALFHIVYLVIFFICCERRLPFLFWLGVGIAFGGGVAGVDLFLKSAGQELAITVGWSGVLTGSIMYLMGTYDNMAVAHRSNGSEGRTVLLATALNATLWTVSAILIEDMSMLTPNGIGVICVVVQILHRFLYYYMPAGEVEGRLRSIWNAWRNGGGSINPNDNGEAGLED